MIDDADSGLYTDREQAIYRTVSRSKVWRLMRDALCLERERLHARLPDPDAPGADRRLWQREGELTQVQRLLRLGPHLVVAYDRYLRDQEAKGEPAVRDETARPGDPPDVGDA